MSTSDLDGPKRSLEANKRKMLQYVRQHTFKNYAGYAKSETSKYFGAKVETAYTPDNTKTDITSTSVSVKTVNKLGHFAFSIIIVVFMMSFIASLILASYIENTEEVRVSESFNEGIEKLCGNYEIEVVFRDVVNHSDMGIYRCANTYWKLSVDESMTSSAQKYAITSDRAASDLFPGAAIGVDEETSNLQRIIILRADSWRDFRDRYAYWVKDYIGAVKNYGYVCDIDCASGAPSISVQFYITNRVEPASQVRLMLFAEGILGRDQVGMISEPLELIISASLSDEAIYERFDQELQRLE